MLTESLVIRNSTQRERQKAATRLRILAAARELYAERGFAAVRSSEVAAAAGVAHGTIFFHFATQESLLAAVVEDFGDRLCRRLHELSTNGVDLRTMLEAQVGAIGEVEGFYARLVVESFLLPKAARDSLVMIQSTVSYHISRAAEAGMAQGRIRRQPLHLLFNTWMGLVHYYLANRELFVPGDWVLAHLGAELVDHYLGLVSIEPAPREERHGGD